MEIWILILLPFFATNPLDEAESVKVKLDETPHKIIDEIFGKGWWDNDRAEEWHKLTLEQNFHHQIDRQNTQIGPIEPNSTDQNAPLTESDHCRQIESNSTDQLGQIEPNSTDQLGQIEPNSTDQLGQIEPNSTDPLGQIEPNSTDRNPPLTESDHSVNAKNGEEQNETMKKMTSNAEDERKRNIIDKFNTMKEEFKQKGNYSAKEWNRIERKIGKHLKVNRTKIFEWKKKFGLSRKSLKYERKKLVKKFDQMKAELKRDGRKNSYELNGTVAKELGLSVRTIYNWKRELGQTVLTHKHSDSEQMELMKRYYEIKTQNPKSDEEIAKKVLKIGTTTLYKWKQHFKRQQFYPNSVDGDQLEGIPGVGAELGITYRTIYAWKRKLGQTKPTHKYSHSEQKELLKLYYEIKDKPPKISDGGIAKRFKIDVTTLRRWKKLHPNVVDGHSVEENAAVNVQEIENSNLGSILMYDQSFEEYAFYVFPFFHIW